MQVIIPIVYTMAVAQAAACLGWPCHWQLHPALNTQQLRSALHAASQSGKHAITDMQPLAAQLIPLLTRLALLLDLATSQEQPGGLAHGKGTIEGQMDALLSRLSLAPPAAVLQALLQLSHLPELLTR